jgi:hypothetical protein
MKRQRITSKENSGTLNKYQARTYKQSLKRRNSLERQRRESWPEYRTSESILASETPERPEVRPDDVDKGEAE